MNQAFLLEPEFNYEHIFKIQNQEEFDSISLKIFSFQRKHVQVYNQYLSYIIPPGTEITDRSAIPFLPVSFFKTKHILTEGCTPQIKFTSSATTGKGNSTHEVADIQLYIESFSLGFKKQFGDPSQYIILGLLPSYLEREDSSLVYMVQRLIELSGNPLSGFYLNNFEELNNVLSAATAAGTKVILLGVTYALLHFSDIYKPELDSNIIVVETGGMKGRREEITKHELHSVMKQNFSIQNIGGEYGMTELLSQAWSVDDGIYTTPPWMKVVITDITDPFHILGNNEWGRINVIDLANIWSCSFIATDDIGKTTGENCFEIAGRIDYSDMRGCSQLFV